MTIYYVRKSGNDGNAGTGTSAAWLTIGKALGASGIASGDTVYIGAGVYREEITVNMTSATVETLVFGDIHGQYTGDVGEVRLTNFLTDDTTAPSETGAILNLNGRDFLTFENITIQAVRNSSEEEIFNAETPTSTNITIRNCTLCNISNTGGASASIINIANAADVAMHWLIDKCILFMPAGGAMVRIGATPGTTVDYDVDVIVQNSVFIGLAYDGSVTLTGFFGASFQPGGVIVKNCTSVGSGALCTLSASSTSIKCKAYNNLVITFDTAAFSAANSGEIVEDYNIVYGPPWAYNNVSAGANTVSDGSYAPLFHIGQEFQNAQHLRPFGAPTDGSPLLGFGGHISVPVYDIMNRPRPSGGLSTGTAVGAYERHDTGTEDTSVYDSAPASMKIRGPGDHDFEIPVNPISTNITVMVRYDTNHGETNKPQVQILANPSIGVNTETLTMTDGIDTWEMLSFSNFTPTDYGIVILRCISRSSTGNGIAYFDSITV